jgi:hypothetical protein
MPLLLAVVALAATGCGSTTSTQGAVAHAASQTSQVQGYRLSGVFTISSPTTGTFSEAMTGAFDRADQRASIRTVAYVGGRSVPISQVISRLTVYMGVGALPNGLALTRGKQWIKIDTSRAIGAVGISSLPTATDPTQFVDFLRAVSSATSLKGIQQIRGVAAQQYHATIDLDRYPNLVSAAQRPAVTRSVRALERGLGGHSLPIDVWIDAQGLVRRVMLGFGECVSRTHFRFDMTLDLFDYGAQAAPKIPPATQVYDVTKAIAKSLRNVKLGCA